MPTHWKKEFRKHGNKLSTQSIDELAQYFDIFHNESPSTSNTSRNIHASTNNNNSQRNTNNNNYNYNGSNTKPNSTSPRLKTEDVCPIHGGHKWHYCIFNKDGPNYRPPSRNTATTTSAKTLNDNFNDEQTRHETNDDDNTATNPYDDDFKSVAPPNEPVPQVITEGISETSDEILIFKNCLLDLKVRNHSFRSHVFPKASLNTNLLNSILHYHYREYIIIMSTLPFLKFVSLNSAPTSSWKMSN